MNDLTKALRQKASGERNSVGDVWGDWLCDEAAALIEAQQARIEALVEGLGKSVETLAASRHLIGKYTPEHHWLAEHDQRIADLKSLVKSLPPG